MSREVKLNRLGTVLSEFDYPIDREAAVAASEGVTLVLAEGEEELDDIVAESNADRFESADDLESEVMGLLPQHAVGEPYQSEGDA